MATQGRAPGTFHSIDFFIFIISSQDTSAQITLLNASSEEIMSNRTVTRRNQHHPVYAERYPFNIQENLLNQITLVITIINKKSSTKADSNIGWISFGKKS